MQTSSERTGVVWNLIVVLCAAVVACTEPTPLYCDEDHPCEPGYWCDLPEKTCVKKEEGRDAAPDLGPAVDRGVDAPAGPGGDAGGDMLEPNGSSCTSTSECLSGHCVDGVCCGTLCALTCHTCAKPGSLGTCVPVEQGSDPDKECAGSDPACAGSCDGKGSCIYPDSSTTCGQKSCSAGKVTTHSCDGKGGCSTETVDCGGYVCDPATNQCKTSCSSTSDCTGTFQCIKGACVGKLPNGSACGKNDKACASQHCVDGVCCDSACTGLCRACDLPGSPGTCGFVPAKTAAPTDCPGDAKCGPGECDGAGACAYPKANQLCGNGNVCTAGAQTAYRCSAKHLCQAGTPTKCTPYVCDSSNTTCLSSCTTSAQCVATAFCSGGKCTAKKALGAGCAGADQCTSGYCVDSVCCDKTCANVCWSCNVAGNKGTCTADPAKNGTTCDTNAVCQQGSCVCKHKSCGATCCASGQVCNNNACCTPNCTGRQCGPDPTCGVSCGTCNGTYEVCKSGKCFCPYKTCGTACCAPGDACNASTSTCSPGSGGWAVATQGVDSGGITVGVDSSKNVYIAGGFTGPTTFGTQTLTSAGKADVFFAKLSPSGVFQWAVGVGGSSNDSVHDLAVDSAGNLYVVGDYSGKVSFGGTTLDSSQASHNFIAKLSPSGKFLWAISPAGAMTLRDIVVDGAGDVHVVGDLYWPATFGTISVTPKAQTSEVLLLKLSPAGNYLAASSFSAGTYADGSGIAVDGAGNRFVAGGFEGSSTAPPLANKGNHDAFVAKVTASGAVSWITPAGDTGNDQCHAIRLNGAGDPIVWGGFEGTVTFGSTSLTANGVDYFVARLSGSSGNFSWVASDLNSTYSDIAVDASGNTFVVGGFQGSTTFGSTPLTSGGSSDAFVAKISPSGAFLWATSAGGTTGESAASIAINSAGHLLVGGMFAGPSTFGGTTLTAANTSDLYVWKLLPP